MSAGDTRSGSAKAERAKAILLKVTNPTCIYFIYLAGFPLFQLLSGASILDSVLSDRNFSQVRDVFQS